MAGAGSSARRRNTSTLRGVGSLADLRRDYDFIALLRKSFRDQLFAQSVAVGIGGVEKRDPEIERLMHKRDRFAFGELAPPAGRNRPETEADFADAEVGVFVGAEAHAEV